MNDSEKLKKYLELCNSDKYIKIHQLKRGFAYVIVARNAHVGIWLPERTSFMISRFKFKNNYLTEEFHWDTGEPHGTVKPQYVIEKAPFDIDLIGCGSDMTMQNFEPYQDELLAYLNQLSEEYPLLSKNYAGGNSMENEIMAYYAKIANDKHHRFRSWEHCYSYFSQEAENFDLDTASLHLAFYLASWGMYRGSSFLLWKDYLIHKEVVKEILKHKDLQNIDFSIDCQEKVQRIYVLMKWIRKWYAEHIQKINGQVKGIKATDTLVTKILLGTLGCVPAYDSVFKKGLKISGITHSNYTRFSPQNFDYLINFYRENKEIFDTIQKTISKKSGIKYPVMKLVDMYFWQAGLEGKK